VAHDPLERLRDGTAWDDFCERLKAAGHQVLDAAPDDPLDRAEGLRYVSRLTRHFLKATIEDADPAAAVLSTETPKIGLDNPDYVYFGARLSAKFEYRLRGSLGDAHMVGFGTYSGGLGTKEGLVRNGYLTSDALEYDANGRFEISLSQEERPGNWLAMRPETNSLQVRQTLLDRRNQQPARIELARTDGGAGPSPLDPARFSRGLDRVGMMVGGVIGQFLGWTEAFRGHAHEIRELDPSLLAVAQGDPNTSYNYSYWELAEDEAFVVEFTPPECEYWNLQIGNHWLESLDFQHYATHVNQETATTRPDGSVQIVVARRDPGVPNWLDTAGHARGGLALRWVGAAHPPQPRTRVAKLETLA